MTWTGDGTKLDGVVGNPTSPDDRHALGARSAPGFAAAQHTLVTLSAGCTLR